MSKELNPGLSEEEIASKLFDMGISKANEIIKSYVLIEDVQTRNNTRYLAFQTACHILANQCFVSSLNRDSGTLNRNLLAAKINDVSDEIYEHVSILEKALAKSKNEET